MKDPLSISLINEILGKVNISGTGVVARNLQAAIDGRGITIECDDKAGSILDTAVFDDVLVWFRMNFNPWFADLSSKLGVEQNQMELIQPGYYSRLNEIIAALNVAKAYYALKANEAFMTSIEDVANVKGIICETLSTGIIEAYELAIGKPEGMNILENSSTIATTYEGSIPEVFKWPDTVTIAYHKKFTRVEQGGNNTGDQAQINSGSKQYLPWVFTAAFGLIAWSAAAKKK